MGSDTGTGSGAVYMYLGYMTRLNTVKIASTMLAMINQRRDFDIHTSSLSVHLSCRMNGLSNGCTNVSATVYGGGPHRPGRRL